MAAKSDKSFREMIREATEALGGVHIVPRAVRAWMGETYGVTPNVAYVSTELSKLRKEAGMPSPMHSGGRPPAGKPADPQVTLRLPVDLAAAAEVHLKKLHSTVLAALAAANPDAALHFRLDGAVGVFSFVPPVKPNEPKKAAVPVEDVPKT